MKRLTLVLGLLTLVIASTGCQPGPAYGYYDVYGNYCGGGPYPGCDYTYGGGKIIAFDDPWYYTSGGTMTGTWQSPDGIFYSGGYAVNSMDDGASRDLIGQAADAEEQLIQKAGRDFAARYALSDDKGIHIARTLNEWATFAIKHGRSLTQADIADFSKRLYGVSFDRAQVAVQAARAGNQAPLLSLNGEVAAFWGTTPETSATILKSWYRDEL